MALTDRHRRLLGIAVANEDDATSFANNISALAVASNAIESSLTVGLPAFADAGDDLTDFPLVSLDVPVTLREIYVVAYGEFQGVDADNTLTIAIKDASGNTIASATYDDETPPEDDAANDLGTPHVTHKLLGANELCTISVTCGANVLPPQLYVILIFNQ